MITHLIQDLKEAPRRLVGGRRELAERARQARAGGQERLWRAQTQALERVGSWLQEAPRTGVLAPIAHTAEKLVDQRLNSLTAVPIPNYEALNARDASRAVRDLESRVALLVVCRHEEAHKNRKTVLRAIEEQLQRLERGPLTPDLSDPSASPV